jgi:hypothetical protein
VFGQQRKPAGVIDMRVGKDNIGQYPGIKGYDHVFFSRFFAPTLKQTAIQ